MKRLHKKDGKPFDLGDIRSVKVRRAYEETDSDRRVGDHVVVTGGPADHWEIAWLPYKTYENALAGAAEIIAAIRKARAASRH